MNGKAAPPAAEAHALPVPLVVSMAMGYGHLRAAHALADELGVEVLHADRPPLAAGEEIRLWEAARRLYEWASRISQWPVVGKPFEKILDAVTAIPHLRPGHDLSAPDRAVRTLGRLIDHGLGRGLAQRLASQGRPLLTTYFAPAVAVDDHRRDAGGTSPAPPLYCVVTDSDLARAWVGRRPTEGKIHYLVPSRRAAQRLAAYGVPEERVEITGFPLPGPLLGGKGLATLRRHLAARLVRLDRSGAFRRRLGPEVESFLGPLPERERGRPPRLAFVVGGAGAQAELASPLLAALGDHLRDGRLRLSLVAGTRPEVAERFRAAARDAGLARPGSGVEVLCESEVDVYFRTFNRLLATTDLLWTKPSEITFFAALGLPLVLTPPIGSQEHHNRRWAEDQGAALRAPAAGETARILTRWLTDGTLAATAWNGFLHLPKQGLYRIADRVRGQSPREPLAPPPNR